MDMNLSPSWASYLRSAGFEAVHWSDIGQSDATDREIMQWAEQNSFAVITADLDFSAILAATGRTGPSVIQIRAEILTPEEIGPAIINTLSRAKSEIEDGAIASIDVGRMRLRVLPLKI